MTEAAARENCTILVFYLLSPHLAPVSVYDFLIFCRTHIGSHKNDSNCSILVKCLAWISAKKKISPIEYRMSLIKKILVIASLMWYSWQHKLRVTICLIVSTNVFLDFPNASFYIIVSFIENITGKYCVIVSKSFSKVNKRSEYSPTFIKHLAASSFPFQVSIPSILLRSPKIFWRNYPKDSEFQPLILNYFHGPLTFLIPYPRPECMLSSNGLLSTVILLKNHVTIN